MIRIGHRGAKGYAPENTLLSFKKALDLGIDMVELDVFTLSDGRVVVIHDAKVDRTTNGHGYVEEKKLDELKQLDAGKGEKIPTLQEVLDLVERKARVNIELKGEHTAEVVAQVVEDYVKTKNWQYEDFSVSSYNHHELKKFKSLQPVVPIGALITGIPIDYAKFAEELGASSVNLDREFINQAYIDDAHKRGLKVFVYTVNDPEDMKRFAKMGVDGLFSDYPDLITQQT